MRDGRSSVRMREQSTDAFRCCAWAGDPVQLPQQQQRIASSHDGRPAQRERALSGAADRTAATRTRCDSSDARAMLLCLVVWASAMPKPCNAECEPTRSLRGRAPPQRQLERSADWSAARRNAQRAGWFSLRLSVSLSAHGESNAAHHSRSDGALGCAGCADADETSRSLLHCAALRRASTRWR